MGEADIYFLALLSPLRCVVWPHMIEVAFCKGCILKNVTHFGVLKTLMGNHSAFGRN